MLTVDWQHIILAASGYSGTSRRIAKMREAGAQFAPPYRQGSWTGNTWMPTQNASEWAPPTYAPPFSPTDPFGDRTYEFVFWSVNGLHSRGFPFGMVHNGNPLPSISFGEEQWTLKAKAWYMWNRAGAGSPGPGEPEVEIDAFDLTSNDFISNDFVNIDPDGPADPNRRGLGNLEYIANEDGYIRTATLSGPITVKAHEFENEQHRYQFVHWLVIQRSESSMPVVNDSTITIQPKSAMRAYAIYHQSDRVTEDVRDPGQVEDVLRPFVLVAGPDGLPHLIADPLGGILPVPPRPTDLKRVVEFLHRMENDLHKLYEF